MVEIEVSIDNEHEFLTRVYCTWTDILGRPCMEKIEIRNDQIPELIKKLTEAMESTGVITVTPELIEEGDMKYVFIILIALIFFAGCSTTEEKVSPIREKTISIVEIRPSTWELGKDSGVFVITADKMIYFSKDQQINQFLSDNSTCKVMVDSETDLRAPSQGTIIGMGGACVKS